MIQRRTLIEKSPPKQVKYILSLKLVEFALELLDQNILENLSPEKIFIMHFNPKIIENMRITLVKAQKSKDKVRLYQSP